MTTDKNRVFVFNLAFVCVVLFVFFGGGLREEIALSRLTHIFVVVLVHTRSITLLRHIMHGTLVIINTPNKHNSDKQLKKYSYFAII